jgi:hypothetical protein
MPDPAQPPDDSAYSPTSGCIILILAVLVLGGGAVFFVVQGFRMDREIDTFTTPTPIEHPIASPDSARRDALHAQLRNFATAALEGRQAELALSASDINDLIAIEPLMRDFRGNTLVTEISGEFLIAEMSQMLNSIKPGKQRYLNARFHFRPRKVEREFDLALVDITGTEQPIPQGFIDLYTQKRFFKPDIENKTLGPILEKITDIEIRDDKLVITAIPPPSSP